MKIDFDAAIFDMDGTLLDTMPYWRMTTLEYLVAKDIPFTKEDVVRVFPTSSRRLLSEILERQGIRVDRQEMISALEKYMNRHYLFDARIKGRSLEFVQVLKERGVRMCVATGSPRGYARNGLRRLGMLDFFEFVTDNYESPWSKERPEYFLNLLDRLGVPADRCWVFEDSLYAIKSAKAAGLRVCAIEDDSQWFDREEIRLLADVYIQDYDELL